MRGIPTPCINYCVEHNNTSYLDVNEKLCRGEVIEFGSINDGNAFVCKHDKDHTISNEHTIHRTLIFVGSESDNTCIN